ncbi:lysozyme [Croceibacterium ferulae]|uniref:lysozyme n=1 Tax=Croceibacterium ferulae TaxID=1854641 RepID=UPI000EB02350|nr:lysozyme [Croceibacterium ferulae]
MNRKAIFDAVRLILGRGISRSEVTRLDDAIDQAITSETTTGGERMIGDAGLRLIREFEGCAKRRSDGTVEAYPDPGTGGAPWTIGWGSTTDEDGKAITPGAVWAQERCDARFATHVAQFAEELAALLGESATGRNQFDALVSLAYNIGTQALASSTLLRMHLAGDHAGAAEQFGRWNRAGGRVLAGLVRRRAAETALYRRADGPLG